MEGTWAVGDKCMAPFSGDGNLYRAVIRKLQKDEKGQKMSEVWFRGYSSDDNELVKLSDIRQMTKSKKSPGASRAGVSDSGFESPLLNYISEEDRIRAQYADMYVEPKPRQRPTESPSTKPSGPRGSKVTPGSKKRKGTVAIHVGGAVKESPKNSHSENRPRNSEVKNTPSPVNVQRTLQVDREEFPDIGEGFSSSDIEKPSFPGKSNVDPKEPLILSAPGEHPIIQVPGTINRYLRDYQRDGVKFLYDHYKNDTGAILGDDMGLGKTVQVIALIAALLEKTGGKEDCERRLPEFLQKTSPEKATTQSKVFLIVCPNSVLYNWLDEFETWTHCIVARYHGKEREETLRRAKRGRLDAVITTYETYRLYIDDMLAIPWDAVFVDEVHKIKEPSALITQALNDVNTNRRYGLTGTALQNKMAELWCVLDWANPDCLGSWRDFRQEYEQVITTGQKYDANKRELAIARKVARRFAQLRSKWMVRRTKALIAHQLPTKDEHVVFCNLSSFQLAVYRALLDSPDMDLVLRRKEPCDCGKNTKRGDCCYKRNARGEGIKSLTFGLMSLLIKVSNHVALLMPDVTMSEKQRQKARQYCDIAFAKHPQFVELSREARFATLSDPSYCGKMQVLAKLLTVFKKANDKVLLFSCYTQLLDILEMYLKTTYYTYRRLDGKTPMADRQRFVHEFNRDPDIFLFLISTKAGGLGLNLTGANVVVIFDPNWNPTHDLQAQDRAYRIGQHRDVRVFRLVSRGSIEENMYLRQVYKQQLASVAVTADNAKRYFTAVAGDKQQQGEIFGLHNLFALRTDESCLTKDVIQREQQTEHGISIVKYKVQTPLEENEKEPLDELLLDDQEKEGESTGIVDSEDDGDDDHGIASQIDDIVSGDDDENNHKDTSGKIAQASKRSPITSSADHAISDTASEESHISDYSDEEEKEERKKKKEVEKHRKESWDKELRKITRGKALLGKDGRPLLRVKGRKAMTRKIYAKKSNDFPNKTADSHQGRNNSDEDSDEGENVKPRGEKPELKRHGSSSVKTAQDVFEKCGVKYIHSNQRVVGASRIEDHVSEVAQRDVFEMGQFSQQPAYCQVPTLQMESSESQKADQTSEKKVPSLKKATSQAASFRLEDTTLLVGQTPLAIRRDQFQDISSVLGFSSPATLASHIHAKSDDECLKLLLEYYQTKFGVGLSAYIKLPEQPKKDSKTDKNDKENRGVGKEDKSSARAGRGRGQKRQGKSNPSRVHQHGKRTVPRGRQRTASKGLHFESDASDDVEELYNDDEDVYSESDDDGYGAVAPRKVKAGRGRRRETVQRASGRGRGRKQSSKRGMKSHEVYQELFSEDEVDFESTFRDVIAKLHRSKALPERTPDVASKDRQTNQKAEKENSDVKTTTPSRTHPDAGETAGKIPSSGPSENPSESERRSNPLKRDQSLSFLDDIFFSSSKAVKRKPPPKKASTKKDKSVIAAMLDAEFMDIGGGTASVDTIDQLSKVKAVKDKNLKSTSIAETTTFDRTRVSHDKEMFMDTTTDDCDDATLWKRNSTFVPRQTLFDLSGESEDSESLFVANAKFKGVGREIT